MAKLQAAALALVLLISCEKKEEMATFTGFAMTIPYQVKVGDPTNMWQKKKVEKVLANEFAKIDHTANHWNPRSKLSQYNTGSAERPQELEKLFALAADVQQLSQGRFAPEKGAEIQLWKAHLENNTEPNAFEIQEARAKNHYDLDGIVKGYAVDQIAKVLKKEGFTSLYIEWGGEIVCVGQHPANRPWKIAAGSRLLEVADCCLATSGDSVQRWGDRTHIFSPEKGVMTTCKKTIRNVTVQAKNCALADALATAAMLYDNAEELNEFINRAKERYEGIYVYDDLL